MSPRYPQIHVKVRSANPLAWVGAVRMALRRAGIGAREIHRFSDLAMGTSSSRRLHQVCDQWVRIDLPAPASEERRSTIH